jgi:class 3 adenylate cyclase
VTVLFADVVHSMDIAAAIGAERLREIMAGLVDCAGAFGYTAIGEQVGLAQRMESAAPPGGVMLSASTARLVEHAAALGDAGLVHIKGTDKAVATLIAAGFQQDEDLTHDG